VPCASSISVHMWKEVFATYQSSVKVTLYYSDSIFINTHLSFTATPVVLLHYHQLRPLPEFLLVHLTFPSRNQQPQSVSELAPTRRRTSHSPGFRPSQLKAQWSNSGVFCILSIQLESQAPVFRLTFQTHRHLRTQEGHVTPFRGVRK
jgi:hypothetical protein